MPQLYTYYITASYYNCSGNAACGPCDANTVGAAWPNVYNHPPDYSAQCGGSVPEPCLGVLGITNFCNSVQNNIDVYDHGPGASCVVDYIYCYPGYNYAFRGVDLTAKAYLLMGGNPAAGYIPVILQAVY